MACSRALAPEDLIDLVQLPEHLQKDPYLAGALQFVYSCTIGVGERRGIAKSQFLPRNLHMLPKTLPTTDYATGLVLAAPTKYLILFGSPSWIRIEPCALPPSRRFGVF